MKLSNIIGRYKMFRRNTNQSAGAAVTELMEYCFYRVLYGSGFPSILSYDFIGFRYLMAQRIWKTMFERESNARLLALINDEEQLPVLRNKLCSPYIFFIKGFLFCCITEIIKLFFKDFMQQIINIIKIIMN